MVDSIERPRILRAIKKCLVSGDQFFQKAMNTLDDIGKGSLGYALTPFVGLYAVKDPKSNYRSALIEIDSAEQALRPLITRFRDGRVNESHFKSKNALVLLGDLAGVDYCIIVRKLVDQSGRDSTWHRRRELRAKIEELMSLVADV